MIVKAFVFSLLLSLAVLNIQPAYLWADDSATTSEKVVSAQDQQKVLDYAIGGCLFGLVAGTVVPGAGNVIGCVVGAMIGANAAKPQP